MLSPSAPKKIRAWPLQTDGLSRSPCAPRLGPAAFARDAIAHWREKLPSDHVQFCFESTSSFDGLQDSDHIACGRPDFLQAIDQFFDLGAFSQLNPFGLAFFRFYRDLGNHFRHALG